jgi:orotidine-5'-phosphate decarboxylase
MIVANMSNNSYDFIENAVELATENEKNVIGFITQCRMGEKFICMTPGISLENKNVDDQKYRSGNIDTDIRIIGRAIYDSKKLDEDIKRLLYYE